MDGSLCAGTMVLGMVEDGLKINYGWDGTLDCPPDGIVFNRGRFMRFEYDES